jgi:phosphatidylinositol glycan class B
MRTHHYYILGGLVLAITAVFSTGFHHWDEHFQVLEFAGWKLGTTPRSALPWEFEARLRPTLQPWLVVALHRALDLAGMADPFRIALLLRLGTAALFLVGMVLLVQGRLRSEALLADPLLRRWYLFLSFLLWPVVYAAVRFSAEGLSMALFLPAFAWVLNGSPQRPITWAAAGLLMGLAFVVRFQVGFMVAGLLAWMVLVRHTGLRQLLPCAAGILLAVCLGVLADRAFYGEWTFTTWNYFNGNILEGKAASFGTDPWWYYFTEVLTQAIPPFSLLYLLPLPIVFLYRPKDAITWTVLPFLLVHVLIGHKELRFLFPMLALLPLLIVTGLGELRERWWPGVTSSRVMRVFAWTFAVVHLLVLAVVMFKPADAQMGLYRTLQRNVTGPITLVHLGEHPYHRVGDIHFYRPPGLVLHDRSIDGPPTGRAPFLFIARDPAALDPGWGASSVVYSTYPAWVERFNVGGWVQRSRNWTVYRVAPP